MAERVLVVPPFRSALAVPDQRRYRASDGSRAGRLRGEPVCEHSRPPDVYGFGAECEAGYDAAKKTVGRKLDVAVETIGQLLMVKITPPDLSNSGGAQMIFNAIRKR
jgi:hypothetical protein